MRGRDGGSEEEGSEEEGMVVEKVHVVYNDVALAAVVCTGRDGMYIDSMYSIDMKKT